MTVENIKRLHKYFTRLSEGDFTARTFDTTTEAQNEGDEEGNQRVGKLTASRISLIKSDALVSKLEMEEKYPKIFKKEEPKVEEPKKESSKKSK